MESAERSIDRERFCRTDWPGIGKDLKEGMEKAKNPTKLTKKQREKWDNYNRIKEEAHLKAMTGEKDPTGVGQHDPGAKLDDGKVDMSLLLSFPDALTEVARVGQYGETKYSYEGWRKVAYGVRRYTAAMLRHLFSKETYDDDPWMDTPQGARFKGKIRHDAQCAWNALARLQLKLENKHEEYK